MSDNSPSGIVIDGVLAELVNDALESGHPMLVGYVNAKSQARLSFRGSIQVQSADQLAIWVRDPNGGLLNSIAANPNLTLMYRDAETRTTIFFYGRAHAVEDAALRERIYEQSPERERSADPDRKGNGVVVDIDQIQGRTAEGPINMTRA